jgi:tetratricopeptide (TPR) repeat protein
MYERRGDLPAALQAAEQAVALAGERSLELAVAQQRRGRVLSLLGVHDEAMRAYRIATSEAEASSYDDARLEIRLGAARTVIMRLEEPERAQDALDDVRGLLERLDEPWPSPRRAQYDELQASLLKRQGQSAQALAEQWLAILQYTLLGSVYERGLAYVNLGTIYERRALASESKREDLRQARVSYEHALELLGPTRPSPAWAQATHGLGHLLVANGGAADWARAELLLAQASTSSGDLQVMALMELVLIRLERWQASDAEAIARKLLTVLREGKSSSPRILFDAWLIVASTLAVADDQAATETAFAGVREAAVMLEKSGVQTPTETAISLAGLDLTVAAQLFEAKPERAKVFARSAQERLLALPLEARPAAMMDAIGEVLAEGSE